MLVCGGHVNLPKWMNQLTKVDKSARQNKWINSPKQTIQLTKLTKLDTPTCQPTKIAKLNNSTRHRPTKLIKSAYQIAKIIKSTNSAHRLFNQSSIHRIIDSLIYLPH